MSAIAAIAIAARQVKELPSRVAHAQRCCTKEMNNPVHWRQHVVSSVWRPHALLMRKDAAPKR